MIVILEGPLAIQSSNGNKTEYVLPIESKHLPGKFSLNYLGKYLNVSLDSTLGSRVSVPCTINTDGESSFIRALVRSAVRGTKYKPRVLFRLPVFLNLMKSLLYTKNACCWILVSFREGELLAIVDAALNENECRGKK